MSQLTFDESFDDQPRTAVSVDAPPSWYTGRTLSHSSVSLYKQCPQKWKFRYVDRIPEKPKSFFSFGKSVHAGLEFLFENRTPDLPDLDAVLSRYRGTWISEGYESASQERWFFKEGERILRGFYAKHRDDHKKVLKVEHRFVMDIEGVPMTGYIDRIDELSDGKLAIIDYKTGKAFDRSRVRTDPQLTLYQLAVRHHFQKEIGTLTLYHLNSLTPLSTSAHSETLERALKRDIVDVARNVLSENFEAKPDKGGHCRWCDYAQICPAFAKSPGTSISLPAETVESVDRLGKIDQRLAALNKERAALARDIREWAERSGSQRVSGTHFEAFVKGADAPGLAPDVRTEPKAGESPS